MRSSFIHNPDIIPISYGKSERFRDELTQVFDLLSRHPESVAIAFGRTRLKPMRYFPYVLDTFLSKAWSM